MELTDIENWVRQLLEKLNKANRYTWLAYHKHNLLCGIEKQSYVETFYLDIESAKACLKAELLRIHNEALNHIEKQKQYPFNI